MGLLSLSLKGLMLFPLVNFKLIKCCVTGLQAYSNG